MRELAMRGAPWTSQEMSDLLDYCETDVAALLALIPFADLARLGVTTDETLFMGRYSGPAVTRINRTGIPMDGSGPSIPIERRYCEP